MADEIDWTEQLGDAVLAQTDGVLEAVQRMRARAVAAGTLTSNDAQVVDTEDDNISIEPADPDVVYVPSYDASTAYTTPPTAAPAGGRHSRSTMSTSDIITTGAIAFGGALLLNEIFDDDDDWLLARAAPHRLGQRRRSIRGAAASNVNGDVNIDRSRDRVVAAATATARRIGDNDRTKIDRNGAWQAEPQRQADAREKIATRSGNQSNAAAARGKLEAASWRRGALRRAASPARRGGEAQRRRDAAASCRPRTRSARRRASRRINDVGLRHQAGGNGKAGLSSDRGRQSLGAAKLPQASKPKAARKAVQAQGGQPADEAGNRRRPRAQGGAEELGLQEVLERQQGQGRFVARHASKGGGGRQPRWRPGGGGGRNASKEFRGMKPYQLTTSTRRRRSGARCSRAALPPAALADAAELPDAASGGRRGDRGAGGQGHATS